jgi:hypothetical protein
VESTLLLREIYHAISLLEALLYFVSFSFSPAQALGQSNLNVDPLRVDRVEAQKQAGKITEDGLTLTVPSYSINYVRCFE